MPTYAVLYRLTGGEVLKIARAKADGTVQQFTDRDQSMYGVAIDPIIVDEATTKAAYDAAVSTLQTTKGAIEARIQATGALQPTPVEEAELLVLTKQRDNARIAYLQDPTLETKQTWTRTVLSLQQAQKRANDRIAQDRADLLTAQEQTDLTVAQAAKDSAYTAWIGTISARDLTGDEPGPLRQLGQAKIYVSGTNTVRNATQPEIDSWAAIEEDQKKELDARQAKRLLKDHPQFRKFAQLMFKAMNQIRQDAGLQPWTRNQILNFIENQTSKDD